MNFKNIFRERKFLFLISFILLILLLILFVTNTNKPTYEILAKVGTKEITKKDFLLNYSFGLPHLKIGKTSLDRKKNYLQFMINEYLLALDAEAKGLHKSPEVKYQAERIKRELLIESIINIDVKPKIKISMEEINEAINKSKVSFKFFFWPEKDLRNALIIKEMFEEKGIDETFKELSQKKSDIHLELSEYTTDYLTWLDIPEKTFEVIKDLPANEFSKPIKMGNLYFIYQVQDIRRESVTTGEQLDKASTFRKILYSGKLQRELLNFVDSLMTPKDIRTKIMVFHTFANAIIDWKKDENNLTFVEWTKNNKDIVSVKKYNDYQDSVLITFNNGSFSLKEFQQHFYFNKITEEYQTKKQFKNHINSVLFLSIRDYFLIAHAEKNSYDKTDWFKHEFMKWTSKFAFEEQLHRYMSQKSSQKISIADKINSDLEQVRLRYEIYINETMLDTIAINETEKSKQTFIQLMKTGVERIAEPIVDGHWKSISR